MTKQEFISTVAKLAQADYSKSKILPSLTISQAILESNWGNSKLTQNGNALFGIKATKSWLGKALNSKTFEFYNGVRSDITDSFRAYDNWEQSVHDHGEFLQAGRYKSVIGEVDYKKASQAIQQAGYATAPSYSDVLIKLIEQNNLSQYDSIAKVNAPSPATPTAPPQKSYYKIEIYSFSTREAAEKVKQALTMLGCNAEIYPKDSTYFKVESFPYSTVARAKEVQDGLKLIASLYSEVKEIK